MENPLTWADLKVFEPDLGEDVSDAMIAATWVKAKKIAPCIGELDADPDQIELVRSTMRAVVLRWHDTGSGAVRQQTAGDFGETFSSYSGGLWRPDEIDDLQGVCGQAVTGKASTIATWGEPTTQTNPFLLG
ncbi:hypothetical protein [Nocardia fluminea]|uniref:hypothetical protein n=1 Tax=Nocardia fluminea TaxID=134984 RepID=UPI0033CAB44A